MRSYPQSCSLPSSIFPDFADKELVRMRSYPQSCSLLKAATSIFADKSAYMLQFYRFLYQLRIRRKMCIFLRGTIGGGHL